MSYDFRFPSDKTFVIAEIGINHNGSVEIAKQLIDASVEAGCDAVKFQKRVPELSLPREKWDVLRDTPWGETMTYLDYRKKIELSVTDYFDLFEYCWEKKILMSASPWDIPSVGVLYAVGVPFIKVASASVTNLPLLQEIARTQRPVVMSTGMSSLEEVQAAVRILLPKVPQLALLACTSTYPAKPENLHLNRIHTLKHLFPECVVGYSGHEPGLWSTLCAVAMGAQLVERHITLDRAMKGSDHGASVEPKGMQLLVREIRNFEVAKGSGEIRVQECEAGDIKRLRG